MSAERILLLEDEEPIRNALRRVLETLGYEVTESSTVREAERLVRDLPLDAAVLDYQLADGTSLELIDVLRTSAPRVPAVILTGHGSVELAVQALQKGADHFLTKPVEMPVLGAVVARLVELGRQERRRLAKESGGRHVDPFLGRSPAMHRLADQARRVAASGTTVLIQGETGVGKGVLASWLHRHSPRRDDPFVDLNCSVLSRELAQSELFGHRKGAFTGAVSDKPGLLEVAHEGTAFLDEIGDLDVLVQPKLLKALEEKRIRRVGDVHDKTVDVRLIAATHRDLAEAVEEGAFREDLYYRISAVPLSVPPLRDRREDIPLLADRLLNTVAAELGRLSIALADESIDALCSYSWPGNVRELKNVLERAVLLAEDDLLRPSDLRFNVPSFDAAPTTAAGPEGLAMDTMERRHIELVLRLTEGNVAEAARRLEVPRSTLYEKIARHRIDVSEIRT